MKFLVWGAGAIGGTLGAHLARAGHDVTFVDRAPEHVAAINTAGLRIEGPIAQFVARTPAFAPDQLRGEFEHVILAVKAQDTEAATRELAPHLEKNGYVVSAQNGLNELVIKAIVGDARTIGCFESEISDSSSWSRRAVAVMKPSTWRARIASKSTRSRSGALSVLAISEV